MTTSNENISHFLPIRPLSRADLERTLLGRHGVVLDGGPVVFDDGHLYLLVRDPAEGRPYHVVYAPAGEEGNGEEGSYVLVGASPVHGVQRPSGTLFKI